MNNIISFSLWGTDEKYYSGAINNIVARDEIYPDWKIRFYVANDINFSWIEHLTCCNNVEIFIVDEPSSWRGLFWRFFPATDSDVDYFISRDTDSILNWREKAAVDDWMNNNIMEHDFHIMRDHLFHNTEILGGMWGCKGGSLKHLNFKIKVYLMTHPLEKGVDQFFLRDIIFPKIQHCHIAHDEFFKYSPEHLTRKFPKHKKLPDNIPQFVGGIYGTEKGY